MLFSNAHHLFYASGVQPVVRENEFAVFGFRRNVANGVVVIFDDSKKLVIVDDANTRVLSRIFLSNRKGFVRAAIINDGVIPIEIRLPKNALDALREMPGAV